MFKKVNKDTIEYFRDSSIKILENYDNTTLEKELQKTKKKSGQEVESEWTSLKRQWINEAMGEIREAKNKEDVVMILDKTVQKIKQETETKNRELLEQYGVSDIVRYDVGLGADAPTGEKVQNKIVSSGELPGLLGEHAYKLDQILNDRKDATAEQIRASTIRMLTKYVEQATSDPKRMERQGEVRKFLKDNSNTNDGGAFFYALKGLKIKNDLLKEGGSLNKMLESQIRKLDDISQKARHSEGRRLSK